MAVKPAPSANHDSLIRLKKKKKKSDRFSKAGRNMHRVGDNALKYLDRLKAVGFSPMFLIGCKTKLIGFHQRI